MHHLGPLYFQGNVRIRLSMCEQRGAGIRLRTALSAAAQQHAVSARVLRAQVTVSVSLRNVLQFSMNGTWTPLVKCIFKNFFLML